jgi:hypothetical protein
MISLVKILKKLAMDGKQTINLKGAPCSKE